MMLLLALAVFGVTGRRVQSGIRGRARNLVQGIGNGPDQIFHTVTRNSGKGVKFTVAPLAALAKSSETRAIGGGVQLRGGDDHRFLDEGRAKGFELAVDNFERVDWSSSLESLVSIRWTSRRVRSTWRRKRMPRPAPKWAPSMRPGRSATTNVRPISVP